MSHRRGAMRVVACLVACRSEDSATATENAISALGKVLQHVPACIPDSQGQALGTAWVQGLPLKADEAEALSAHAQLVAFLERQDARSVANSGSPKAIACPEPMQATSTCHMLTLSPCML